MRQGFPRGLATTIATSKDEFEHRVWILDNSGSMIIRDGHRVVETSSRKVEGQVVTRWEELQQTVLYHAEMAAHLKLPTEFMLLNDPGEGCVQDFAVGFDEAGPANELRVVRNTMNASSPIGVTNLTQAVNTVASSVADREDELGVEASELSSSVPYTGSS